MSKQPSPQQNPNDSVAVRIAFHARAGQSADELRKALLTLSTGAFGLFFVTLTGTTPLVLSTPEKAWLCVALGAFAFAIFCSLCTWECAGRMFHDMAGGASAGQGNNHWWMATFHNVLLFCFFSGVIASGIYLLIHMKIL